MIFRILMRIFGRVFGNKFPHFMLTASMGGLGYFIYKKTEEVKYQYGKI